MSGKSLECKRLWTLLPAAAHLYVENSPGAILLATSRFDSSNRHSYLFQQPKGIITASVLNDLTEVFARIEEALANGLYVAGFLSYECGYHFEHVVDDPPVLEDFPLAWFGVYEKPLVFDHIQGCFLGTSLPMQSGKESAQYADAVLDQVTLTVPQNEYVASIAAIKDYIADGDSYQVNFTDAVSFRTKLSPSSLFGALSKQQSVAYGAMMNIAGHHVLSLSPELFFRTDGNTIITRPMKGTIPRGLDSAGDEQAACRLQRDEKNRSEHVMIVDLLRNDLGRICAAGSVRVDDLFSVEHYETLLQMTSTISGELLPGVLFHDIFRSIFPCGSITGAPKIRTMQIIHELESSPRGIYTGAIGFIAPDRSAVFNVAIRTLLMKDGHVRMGVGGGIVADSVPEEEYRECLLKASFLTRAHHYFQLIETVLWENEYYLLSLHLDRLESSARYFSFIFDRAGIRLQLLEFAQSLSLGQRYRVRLLLDSTGKLLITSSPVANVLQTVRIRLSPHRTSSSHVFLRHKTTQRHLYDQQYAEAKAEGFDEVIFLNERGEVTEGAISNFFIERSGKLLTPPLNCGVLPGIMRRHLLETNPTAEECVLNLEELKAAESVFLCNSVLGLRRVTCISSDVTPSQS
jgi:para-aminobenzoate synthetase/4-amino-4-deoxychorismate lyase